MNGVQNLLLAPVVPKRSGAGKGKQESVQRWGFIEWPWEGSGSGVSRERGERKYGARAREEIRRFGKTWARLGRVVETREAPLCNS